MKGQRRGGEGRRGEERGEDKTREKEDTVSEFTKCTYRKCCTWHYTYVSTQKAPLHAGIEVSLSATYVLVYHSYLASGWYNI